VHTQRKTYGRKFLPDPALSVTALTSKILHVDFNYFLSTK